MNLNAHVTAVQLEGGTQFINYCHVIICFSVPKEIAHHVNESLPGSFLSTGH